MEPVKQTQLAGRVAKFFGKRKCPRQAGSGCVVNLARQHPGRSEGSMKREIMLCAPVRCIECLYGADRPELAFSQQRSLKEHGHRCSCQCNAHRAVSSVRETPRQRAAHVAKLVGDCGEAFAWAVVNALQQL